MFIEKKINIQRPAHEVFDYISDLSQIYEWDDHVVEAYRLELGPIRVGSKFKLIYSVMGVKEELIYTIETMSQPQHLKLIGTSRLFSAIDQIEITAIGKEQCFLLYSAEIRLKTSQAEKFIKLYMERVSNRLMKRLRDSLEKVNETGKQQKYVNPLTAPFWFTRKGWDQRRKDFKATLHHPKKVLITGPTAGLGKSVARTMAAKGCSLVLVGRSSDKLDVLENELLDLGFEGELNSYVCDMENLKNVEDTCNKIMAEDQVPEVVINNAAALYAKPAFIQEIERTTVVDLIAPWLIAVKLAPALQKGSCIINVSSGGMYAVGLDIPELKQAKIPFSGARAYALAKRGLDIMSWGLNKDLEEQGVKVHSMHPGWADTPGVVQSLPGFHKVTKRWLRNPFQGADTICWLALNNPDPGGEFWLDRTRQSRYLIPATRGRLTEDYKQLKSFLEGFSRKGR